MTFLLLTLMMIVTGATFPPAIPIQAVSLVLYQGGLIPRNRRRPLNQTSGAGA